LNPNEALQHVVYASYPRSGNTFMRNYFEQISGIYTGGNMDEEVTCDKKL
jgi:hypothetical protein